MTRAPIAQAGTISGLKRLLVGAGLIGLAGCQTSKSATSNPLTDSANPTWVDRSINVEQDAINPCDWSNEGRSIQCVFIERSTLKAWSAGVTAYGAEHYPELKTWQHADDHCKAMKGFGHIKNWRLPTIDEAQAALLNRDGTYRRHSLIDLMESFPALGLWPKYGLVWTDTSDPTERLARFAVLRGPASAPAAPSSVDRPKHWLCIADVNVDALRGDPLTRTAATPVVPAASSSSTRLAAKPLPVRSCPADYPGDAESKFRISTLYKSKIVSALAEDVPSAAIGSFGQLIVSAISGVSIEDGGSAVASNTRERLHHLIGKYLQAVTEAVGPGHAIGYFIAGHASPSYNRVYLSPEECVGKGPNLNHTFAGDRAKTIAEVITSSRPDLSGKVEIKSFGHNYPLKAAGEVFDKFCGSYDCEASRRVEIFFHVSTAASAE